MLEPMLSLATHMGTQLQREVRLAYLPNYAVKSAQLLTAGVDLWLNTPLLPYEASGTSGVKAAHNGCWLPTGPHA